MKPNAALAILFSFGITSAAADEAVYLQCRGTFKGCVAKDHRGMLCDPIHTVTCVSATPALAAPSWDDVCKWASSRAVGTATTTSAAVGMNATIMALTATATPHDGRAHVLEKGEQLKQAMRP
jgi:hypothetical protein